MKWQSHFHTRKCGTKAHFLNFDLSGKWRVVDICAMQRERYSKVSQKLKNWQIVYRYPSTSDVWSLRSTCCCSIPLFHMYIFTDIVPYNSFKATKSPTNQPTINLKSLDKVFLFDQLQKPIFTHETLCPIFAGSNISGGYTNLCFELGIFIVWLSKKENVTTNDIDEIFLF